MRFFTFCCVLSFTLFAAQANAGQPGLYMSGTFGMTILSDSDLDPDVGATVVFESDVGFGIGVAGGYEFGNGPRAELELAYRRNGANTVAGSPVDGSASSFAVMANGAYDFDLGQFVPYVGAGLGFAGVFADIDSGGVKIVNDAGMGFAYQLLGGIGYKLKPNVTLTFDYRYFATTDVTMTDEVGNDFSAEYSTHNFMLGARYKF